FVISLAKKLLERGHYVEVYALPLPLGGPKPLDLRLIRELPYREAWRVRVKGFDVAYYVYTLSLLKLHTNDAPKVAGIHSLIWSRGATPSYLLQLPASSAYIVWRLFCTRELKRYDAVHLYSSDLLKLSGLDKHILPGKVYIVPQGIDVDTFKPTCSKDDEFTVLYCGRRSMYKGFGDYIKIARYYRRRYGEIKFTYVGGDVRDSQVISLGYVSDPKKLARIYSRSHVLLMPQRVPTVGRVPLEALSCGTPVVISTSIPQELKGARAIIEAYSIEAFARTVNLLKELWDSDRKKYLELAKQARYFIKNNLSTEATFSKLENMLREVSRRSAWLS
ncbi:MAG: glycosyltransferase, partial [Candidatus Nezhaarchaeota archaeon]|nr:glycosyltransferase [Candidatus Nezhaarchaeota archaeon]